MAKHCLATARHNKEKSCSCRLVRSSVPRSSYPGFQAVLVIKMSQCRSATSGGRISEASSLGLGLLLVAETGPMYSGCPQQPCNSKEIRVLQRSHTSGMVLRCKSNQVPGRVHSNVFPPPPLNWANQRHRSRSSYPSQGPRGCGSDARAATTSPESIDWHSGTGAFPFILFCVWSTRPEVPGRRSHNCLNEYITTCPPSPLPHPR